MTSPHQERFLSLSGGGGAFKIHTTNEEQISGKVHKHTHVNGFLSVSSNLFSQESVDTTEEELLLRSRVRELEDEVRQFQVLCLNTCHPIDSWSFLTYCWLRLFNFHDFFFSIRVELLLCNEMEHFDSSELL